MSKAEKTKQFIIEKTAPLFNTKGYAATSLSDITAITGLTKGSIYGNFSNKDEVIIEAFKYNVSLLRKKIGGALNQGDNPKEALLSFVAFYRNHWEYLVQTGGCVLLNAATEADDHLFFLKESVQHNFKAWEDRLVEVIKAGQVQGYFKPEIAADDLAALMVMLVEGGVLLSRTLANKRHLDIALDQIERMITIEMSS